MHTVLFYARMPSGTSIRWTDFVMAADDRLKKAKAVTRLAGNIWLIGCRENPTALGWLIVEADKNGIEYGLLPFEHEPEWLPASFDPTLN